MPPFDAGGFLELAERERCTYTILSPTQIRAIVNHPDAGTRDLTSLRFVLYGSEPIAEEPLREAQQLWGNVMYQFYGQGEVLFATLLPPSCHVVEGNERDRRRLRSAGRPISNCVVRILDDDGKELPRGEVGEVTVRGTGLMRELWNDPQLTAERVTGSGWVRTRDLGYLDEDGFLYIADRKEDAIDVAGVTIWPAEVENVLYAHPAVLEAVVVSVPSSGLGHEARAVVVAKSGAHPSADELARWCRERLGDTKTPASFELRDQPLPKSSVGKVVRRLVRDPYWQE